MTCFEKWEYVSFCKSLCLDIGDYWCLLVCEYKLHYVAKDLKNPLSQKWTNHWHLQFFGSSPYLTVLGVWDIMLVVSYAWNASKITVWLVWKTSRLGSWLMFFFFSSLKSDTFSSGCKFICFPTASESINKLWLADNRQQSEGVTALKCSLWAHLAKTDVPARLMPSLSVDGLELESWTKSYLLTQFVVMGLNVHDTCSELKITADTSKGKLSRAACYCTWRALCLGECLVLSWLDIGFSNDKSFLFCSAVFLELVVEKLCINAQEYFWNCWHI